MEITVGNIVAALGVILTAASLGFGVIKWVQASIRDVRAEHDQEMSRLDSKLESIRAECAKRDDMTRLDNTLQGIHRRIDEVLAMMASRTRAEG